MKEKPIRVVELFAGVGGFRIGLEKSSYKVVWSNQWESSTKIQHASKVYEARFGKENHSNEDINEVLSRNIEEIPDHDLLVAGFPCQDYSVAGTLKTLKGLKGKKGVLWWSIHRLLAKKKNKPQYLLLENVDRLLKSPSKQRGRDFAVMIKSLNELGYIVEWRVINAADYGMPQKRKRIFILAYHKSTKIFRCIQEMKKTNWLLNEGIFAKSFPVIKKVPLKTLKIEESLLYLSQNFNKMSKKSPFKNTGLAIDGTVYIISTKPNYLGKVTVLGDILDSEVSREFFIKESEKQRWEYLKGAKKEKRKTKEGYIYSYCEGKVAYPDSLENPSRTIITSEGGNSPSRCKHVIRNDKGLRRLTPLELERLNMFPDDHTKVEGITDSKRAFLMGNALVVGIVEKIGVELYKQISTKTCA